MRTILRNLGREGHMAVNLQAMQADRAGTAQSIGNTEHLQPITLKSIDWLIHIQKYQRFECNNSGPIGA